MKRSDDVEPTNEGSVTLSAVTDADREFLIRVYAEARGSELARTTWTEGQILEFVEHQLDAQTRHYHAVYPNSTHEIISLNDEPAGRILPVRGNGNGTAVSHYRRVTPIPLRTAQRRGIFRPCRGGLYRSGITGESQLQRSGMFIAAYAVRRI